MDWTKPIVAVNKETGQNVKVSYLGKRDGKRETTIPDRSTSNSLWTDDGTDICSQDKWYVRNVEAEQSPIPISKYYVGKDGLAKKLPVGRLPPKTRRPMPTGVLIRIVDNPKKRGSASAKRYDQYVLGRTAAWHVTTTELTAADILWDVEHNFTSYGTKEY